MEINHIVVGVFAAEVVAVSARVVQIVMDRNERIDERRLIAKLGENLPTLLAAPDGLTKPDYAGHTPIERTKRTR